jgi:transposase
MSGVVASRRYPQELKEPAVRMVAEIRGDHGSEWAAMGQVADGLGVGSVETVRMWCRQVEVDRGSRPGVSSEEAAEVRRLRRENAELRRANAILKAASASSRPSEPGPHGVGLRWGVEPMCTVLSEHGITISPSTFYEWVAVST